jgi:hypothetical protein
MVTHCSLGKYCSQNAVTGYKMTKGTISDMCYIYPISSSSVSTNKQRKINIVCTNVGLYN